MPGCAILTCKNTNITTKGTDIRYHSFPMNENLQQQWIYACQRKDKINLKNARICSKHFEASSFEIPLKHRLLQYNPKNSRNLKTDAVPVLHLPESSCKKIVNTGNALEIEDKEILACKNFSEADKDQIGANEEIPKQDSNIRGRKPLRN